MWHIFTTEYYVAIKRMCSCHLREMDEAGSHHSPQTNTGTENQTLHVLTHKWELNNENTMRQGWEHHTPGTVGGWGLGEIPNVDDGVMNTANHHGMCITM